MLFSGLIYGFFTLEAIDEDYYAEKISIEEAEAMDKRATMVSLASMFGGWYFMAKGNKQFLDAIDIYNNNIEWHQEKSTKWFQGKILSYHRKSAVSNSLLNQSLLVVVSVKICLRITPAIPLEIRI